MRLTTRLATRRLRLPGAGAHRVSVQRAMSVPMPDGSSLRADRYYPRDVQDTPLVVMTGLLDGGRPCHSLLARMIAERGYQVLLHGHQLGSADGHRAMDADDRQAVLAWIGEQPWFPGAITALSAV